jgi:hypothetical protein
MAVLCGTPSRLGLSALPWSPLRALALFTPRPLHVRSTVLSGVVHGVVAPRQPHARRASRGASTQCSRRLFVTFMVTLSRDV